MDTLPVILLKKIAVELYGESHIRIFRDRENQLCMSWTGERPETLKHLLLDPLVWDVTVNYLRKRAWVDMRTRGDE